jgi:DNA-binding Xre family transcriptional regulator
MDKIIEQIEQRLNEKNMTQKSLADELGVLPSNFNKRFRAGTMKMKEVLKVCEILEIDNLQLK